MANNEIENKEKKIENKETGIYTQPELSQIQLTTDPVFNEPTDLQETNQELTTKLEVAGLNADYINKQEEAADTKENWFFKMLDYTLLVPLHAAEGGLTGLLNAVWGNSSEDLWGQDAETVDNALNGVFRQIFGSAWNTIKGDELYNGQRLSGANVWAELLTGDPDTTDWNRWARLTAGLTTDIFLDPLTYTGIPFLSEGITAASKRIGKGLEYKTQDFEKFSSALKDALDADIAEGQVPWFKSVQATRKDLADIVTKKNINKAEDTVVKNDKILTPIQSETEKFLGFVPEDIIKSYATTGQIPKQDIMQLLRAQSLYRVAKRTGLGGDIKTAQDLLDIENNITSGTESLNRTGRKALSSYALKNAIEDTEVYRKATQELKNRIELGGKDGENAKTLLDKFNKKYTKKIDLKNYSSNRTKEKAKALFKFGDELTDDQFQKLLKKRGNITKQEFDTIARQKALWNVLNNKYSVLDRTEAVSNLTKDAAGTLSQLSWQKLYEATNSVTLLEQAREKIRKTKTRSKTGTISKEAKEKIDKDPNLSDPVKEAMKNMNAEELTEVRKIFRPKNFYEWWSSHLTGTQAKKVYRRTRDEINVAKRRATATIAKIMRNASEGNKKSVQMVRNLLTSENVYDDFLKNAWERFSTTTDELPNQTIFTNEKDYRNVLTQILDNLVTVEEKNIDFEKIRNILTTSQLLDSESVNDFIKMYEDAIPDLRNSVDNEFAKRGTINDLIRTAMVTNAGSKTYTGTTKPLNSFLSPDIVKNLEDKFGISVVEPSQLVAEFWRSSRREKLATLQNSIRAAIGWELQGTPKIMVGDFINNFLENSTYISGLRKEKAKQEVSKIKKGADFEKTKDLFDETFKKNPKLSPTEIRELVQFAFDSDNLLSAIEVLTDTVGVPLSDLGIYVTAKNEKNLREYIKKAANGLNPITSELRGLVQTVPSELKQIDVKDFMKNPEKFSDILSTNMVTLFSQNDTLNKDISTFLTNLKQGSSEIITDTNINDYLTKIASNLIAKRETFLPPKNIRWALSNRPELGFDYPEALKEVNKIIPDDILSPPVKITDRSTGENLNEKAFISDLPETTETIDDVLKDEAIPKSEIPVNEETLREFEKVENQIKSILNVASPNTTDINFENFLNKSIAQQVYSLRVHLKRALGLNAGNYRQDLFVTDMLQAILKNSSRFSLKDFPKTPSTVKNLSSFLKLIQNDIPQQLLLSTKEGDKFALTALNNIKSYIEKVPVEDRNFSVLEYLSKRGELFSPLENFTSETSKNISERFPTLLTFVTSANKADIDKALSKIRELVPKENLNNYDNYLGRLKNFGSEETRLVLPVNQITNDLNQLTPVFSILRDLDKTPSIFNINRFVTDNNWRMFYKLANANSVDEFKKYYNSVKNKLPKKFRNPNKKDRQDFTPAEIVRQKGYLTKQESLDLLNSFKKSGKTLTKKNVNELQTALNTILKQDWTQIWRQIERQDNFKVNRLIPDNYNLKHTLSKDLNTLATNYTEDTLNEGNFRFYFKNIPELNQRLKQDPRFLQRISPENDLELVFNSNPLAYLVDAIDPNDLTLFGNILKENIPTADYQNFMDIITDEASLNAFRSLSDSFKRNELRKLGLQGVVENNVANLEKRAEHIINNVGIRDLHALQISRLSDYISTAAPTRAKNKYLLQRDDFQELLSHARAMNDLVSNEFYSALKNNSNERLNRLRYYTDFLGNPLLDEKKLQDYAELNNIPRSKLNLSEVPDIWKYQTKDFLRNMISPNTFKNKEMPYQQTERKRVGSAPAVNERVGKFQIANIGKANTPQIVPTPLFIESYLERVMDLARHAQGLSKVKNTLTAAILNGAIRPASSVPNVERDKFRVLRKEDFNQILPRIYTETTGERADLVNAIRELGLPDNSIIEQVEKLSSYFETPDALKQVQSASNFGALEEPLVIQKNVYNTLVRHMINDKDIKKFERMWRNITNFEKKLILFNPGYVFRVFAGNWMQALLGGLKSTEYWDAFANGVKNLTDLRGLVDDLENIKNELIKANPKLWSVRNVDAVEEEIYKQINNLAPRTPELAGLLNDKKRFKYLQKLDRQDIEHNPILHYLYTTKDELLSQGVLEDQTLKMNRNLPRNSKTASRYNTPSVWRRAIVKDFNKELDPSKMRVPSAAVKGTLNLPISMTIYLTDAARLGGYLKVVEEIRKAGSGNRDSIKFLRNKFIDLNRTDTAEKAAAAWVRSTFFDTLRLSNFEDQYLVNLIPFYRFMRLSIEQNIRELARGNLVPYEKAWRTFMSFANVADGGAGEYGWNMFPDYVLQELYLPVPVPGQEDEYAALKWGFTPSSLLDFIANPNENVFSGLYSTLNPFIKAPIDIATGINSYTGNDYDYRFLGPLYNDLIPSGIRNFFSGAGIEDLFRSRYEKQYVPLDPVDNRFLNGLESALFESLYTTFDTADQIIWWMNERNAILNNILTVMESAGYWVPSINDLYPDIRKYMKYIAPSSLDYY